MYVYPLAVRSYQVRRFYYCYSWYTDGAAYWEMVTKATEKNLIGQVFKGDASKAHSGDQLK